MLHIVNVYLVSTKTKLVNVSNVDQNVKPVILKVIVKLVPVTELVPLIVVVHNISMMMVIVNVKDVLMLVLNVILMVTVPSVEPMLIQSQIVFVFLTISQIPIKVKKFVKFVMSDVLNVLLFSITVHLVPLVPEDKLLHIVNVQLDI